MSVSAATYGRESTTTSKSLTWNSSTSSSKTTYSTTRSGTGFMGCYARKAGTKSDFGVEHYRSGAQYRFLTGIVNNAASGNIIYLKTVLRDDKGNLKSQTSSGEKQINLRAQYNLRLDAKNADYVPDKYYTISTGYIKQAPTSSSPVINEYSATIHDKK